MARAFIDLHCHTSASFNSIAKPADVVRAAQSRGLTHLVISDHDKIDGAIAAREAASDDLFVIIGEEVKTADGDLICAYLERAIPPGMSSVETIAAAREQGALVGIPHPFDRMRGSLLKEAKTDSIAPLVDWVETHNARLIGKGNDLAVEYAHEHGLPGVAVSDAHSTLEVGVAYTVLDGDLSTAAGLLAALASAEHPELIAGRATYGVRLWTPFAKGIQRLRGNRRVQPVGVGPDGPTGDTR